MMPEIHDFDDLLDAVGATDLVIATRYHNVVAALMMRRPVVSLSYAPKNGDLLREVGIEGFDRRVEEATPAWVIDRVDAIRSGRSAFGGPVWEILDDWDQAVRDEAIRVLNSAGLAR